MENINESTETKLKKALLQIEILQEENKYLKELLHLRLKEQYARKCEQLKELGYITLFDDIELNKQIAETENKIVEQKVNGYIRKKKKNLVNDNSSLEVRVEHITMEDENLKDINSDIIVNKLQHIPEQFYISEIHIHQYQKKTDEGTIIVRPEVKESIFGKSMVSESLINSIIYKRIVEGMPLYRQEQSLSYRGINLSRQNMSNYIYQAFDVYEPIIGLIKKYVLEADVLRSDETTQLVLEINKKGKVDAKSNSYIWGVSTGNSYHPAIYYRLGPGRTKEVAKELFENNHHKYLMTDCYSAYFNLKNTTNVFCLVHINRAFKKLLDKTSSKDNPSAIIVSKISKIFHEDNLISKLYEKDYDSIKEARLNIIKPLFDDLYDTINNYFLLTLPKSGLGKALSYALSAKEGLYNYLLDGRLELENNYSEREVIRPWVISRKASLFSNTVKGADVTCGLYTLLRTAIANNLKPFDYLQYLALNLPINTNDKFDYSKFVPWSISLPNAIKK